MVLSHNGIPYSCKFNILHMTGAMLNVCNVILGSKTFTILPCHDIKSVSNSVLSGYQTFIIFIRFIQCHPKVLEQNEIFSHNFKICVNLKCPLQLIWIEDQAQRNVGPNLRSILFDTQHQVLLKSGCIAWYYLNYVAL